MPNVEKVITDGRYYCFEAASGDFLTLDIGVNFLTYTLQEKYEAWLSGEKIE